MKRFDEDILVVLPGLLNAIEPSFIKFVNSLPQVTKRKVYLFIPTWDIPENIVCLNNLKKEISKDIIFNPITFTYKEVKVFDYVSSFNKSILGKDLEVIESRGLKMFMMHFCMKQLYKNKLWNSKKQGFVIKAKNNIQIRKGKNFQEIFQFNDKTAFYANHEMFFVTRKNILDKLYSDIDKGIYSYFSSFCSDEVPNIFYCKQEGGDKLLFYLLNRLNIRTIPLKFPMSIGNSYSPNLVITRDKVKQVCLLFDKDNFKKQGIPEVNFRVKYLGEIK